MGTVIKVNFQTKKRIDKFTTKKYKCMNCSEAFVKDSRVETELDFVSFGDHPVNGLCKECAILVKKVVEDEGW